MDNLLDNLITEFNLKVKKSECSNSIYISLTDSKKIRISDHISTTNAGKYLNVLLTKDDKYVVAFKNTIRIITSLKRLEEYLRDFLDIHYEISKDYENKIKREIARSEMDIKSLRQTNKELKLELGNKMDAIKWKEKSIRQAEALTNLNELTKQKNEIIESLKKDNEDKSNAIQEAVDLIKTLTEDPNSRDLLYSKNTGKTYYLDNFPEYEQGIINECIVNYNRK